MAGHLRTVTVAASTQNPANCPLLFLYREVLGMAALERKLDRLLLAELRPLRADALRSGVQLH